MDGLLPYRVLSPLAVRPIKAKRNKVSKLSLKYRSNTKETGKENSPPSFPDHGKSKQFSADLLTDDESETERSYYSRGGTTKDVSLCSTVFRESQLSLPIAESTRCEMFQGIEKPSSIGECKTMTFITATDRSHQSTGSSTSTGSSPSNFVTALSAPVGCDESIICISDSGEDSPLPDRKTAKKCQPVSILISSDESDEESGRKSADSLRSLRKSLGHVGIATVIPPSESEGDHSSGSNKRSLNVTSSSPRKRNSTYARMKSLISEDKSSIIPPSADITFGSVIESSIIEERKPTRKSVIVSAPNKPVQLTYEESLKKTDETLGSEASKGDTNESWKNNFRLVMPESSSSEEEQATKGTLPKAQRCKEESPEPEPLFPSNSIKQVTLSRRKYEDIERWLIRGHTTDSEDSDIVPPSPVRSEVRVLEPSSEKPSHKEVKNTVSELRSQSESTAAKKLVVKHYSQHSSSADNFDAMMDSLVKKRQGSKQISSSFLTDSSHSSASPSFYHREVTNTIKKDVDTVRQLAKDQLKKRLTYTGQSDSGKSETEADSDDSWLHTKRKIVGSTKKSQRKVRAVIESDDSDGDESDDVFETPSRKPIMKSNPKKAPVITDSSSTQSDEFIQEKPNVPKKMQTVLKTDKTPQNRKVADLKSRATPYSPIRTFLSSLSGPPQEKGIRSHPEAEKYCKNYKNLKEELGRRLYKLYNKEIFDSRLPADMSLEWNARMLRTAGFCYCKLVRKGEHTGRSARIVLSTKVLSTADRLRDTLVHEMCHAAVWLLNNISGGHGPLWKAWADKAMKRFPELPEISRCHDYNIETKFTYRCTSCGYSFGRHSKSLDLQRQRCGYCYGTFEVLVNKGNGNRHRSAPEPKIPRTPNAFALFVKENYSSVKKDNASFKHGDVMKALSQKFAEIKMKQSV